MKLSKQVLKELLVIPCLAVLLSACGTVTITNINLKPKMENIQTADTVPLSVAMVVDKDLLRYTAKGWEPINVDIEYVVTSLPNYYTRVLNNRFESVEIIHEGEKIPQDDFDLVARMSVNEWFCKVPIQTYLDESVKISISFSMEDVNGKPLFSKTISRVNSRPYQVDAKRFEHLSSPALEEIFTELSIELGKSEKIQNLANE